MLLHVQALGLGGIAKTHWRLVSFPSQFGTFTKLGPKEPKYRILQQQPGTGKRETVGP